MGELETLTYAADGGIARARYITRQQGGESRRY